MTITLLKNACHLRSEFIQKFLMPWDVFQRVHKDFIKNMAKTHSVVFDLKMYEESHMWDLIHPDHPRVSFSDALALLKQIEDPVIFMSEAAPHSRPGKLCYHNENIENFIAQVNAKELADLVENEWFSAYRLAEQDMYDPYAILPEDLYVFDTSLQWFIVFTHETTDWDVELDDPMKAAASRICIVHMPKQ